MNEEGGIRRKVRLFFSTSNPLAFALKWAIRSRGLDEMEFDVDKFNLNKIMGVLVHAPILHWEREMTYSFVRYSYVIGRDDDKEKIIQLLMQSSDDDQVNVSILPLV